MEGNVKLEDSTPLVTLVPLQRCKPHVKSEPLESNGTNYPFNGLNENKHQQLLSLVPVHKFETNVVPIKCETDLDPIQNCETDLISVQKSETDFTVPVQKCDTNVVMQIHTLKIDVKTEPFYSNAAVIPSNGFSESKLEPYISPIPVHKFEMAVQKCETDLTVPLQKCETSVLVSVQKHKISDDDDSNNNNIVSGDSCNELTSMICKSPKYTRSQETHTSNDFSEDILVNTEENSVKKNLVLSVNCMKNGSKSIKRYLKNSRKNKGATCSKSSNSSVSSFQKDNLPVNAAAEKGLDGVNDPLTACESGMCKKQNKNYRSIRQNSSRSDQYSCHICNKSFSFKNSLQRHYSVHSNTISYACVICNKLFSQRGGMIIHYKRHKNKKSTLFIQDAEKSDSLVEFKKKDSETSIQNFDCVCIQSTCDICNNSFSYKHSLKRHMLIHAGQRNHLCPLCNKSFIRKSDLHIHYKIHKNRVEGSKPYACDLCGKTFSSKVYIYQHMQIHTPVRSYKCHLCTKVYKSQATLQKHLKTHNSITDVEKNHVCEICTKPFRRFKELKKHMVVHTGEKSHVCVLCSKAYRWKSDLIKHVKTHTGEIHVCHVCGKSFSLKQNLSRHMAVHSDIRPYKCLMCDKSYKHNRSLKNHFKTHK